MQPGETLLGRYEIVSKIGAGGYGAIYKAIQISTGQLVAVKMLLPGRLSDEQTRNEELGRFEREMQLIGRLSHPNIVRLIDSGVTENQRFMVLEYVDGVDLGAYLKQGPMEPATVKRSMVQVLDALAEAHAMGVIHRDMKPQNIMLSGREPRLNVKVLDFGIAGVTEEKRTDDYKALTESGTIPGTPSYMAPEQIRAGESSPCSDLYALGLILLECLTGVRAVTGLSAGDICVKQIMDPVSIPEAIRQSPFGAVIVRACSKDVRDRYQSADEMLSALESADVSGLVRVNTGRVMNPLGLGNETGNLSHDFVPAASYSGDSLTPTPAPRIRASSARFQHAEKEEDFSPTVVSSRLEHLNEEEPRRGNAAALWLIAAALVLLTVAAGFFILQGKETEAAKGSAEEERVEGSNQGLTPLAAENAALKQGPTIGVAHGVAGLPSAPDTPKEAVAATASTSTWAVQSTPSAKVVLGDTEVCAATPCEVTLPRPDAALTVVLKARGYSDQRVMFEPNGGVMEVLLKRRRGSGSDAEVMAPVSTGDKRIKEFE